MIAKNKVWPFCLRTYVTASRSLISQYARSEQLNRDILTVDDPRFPQVLRRIGFIDLSDSITENQKELFGSSLPPLIDATALSAMRSLRLYKSARLFTLIRLKQSRRTAPNFFIEACRMLVDFQLENTKEKEDSEVLKLLKNHIDEVIPPFKAASQLYMASLEPLKSLPEFPSNLIDKDHVTTALLDRCIRDKNMNMALLLLEREKDYPILYSMPLLHNLSMFCACEPSFSEVFVERLLLLKKPIEFSFLEPISKILTSSRCWAIDLNAKILKKGVCSSCQQKLFSPKQLNNEELSELRTTIRTILEQGSAEFKIGSPGELRGLQQHVRRIAKKRGRSLVVDTLNANAGVPTKDSLYLKLLKLLEDFDTIMLVTRFGTDEKFLRRVKAINISVFICDRKSDDDLFVMLAALELGSSCYIFSNDQFLHYKEKLPDVMRPLFDRWLMTRVVRHQVTSTRYYMPHEFGLFPQKSEKGVHLPFTTPKHFGQFLETYQWICAKKLLPGTKIRSVKTKSTFSSQQ